MDWRTTFLFAAAAYAAEDEAEACYTCAADERTGEPVIRVSFPDASFGFSIARARASADEAERVMAETPVGRRQQALADLAMGIRHVADQADEMAKVPSP